MLIASRSTLCLSSALVLLSFAASLRAQQKVGFKTAQSAPSAEVKSKQPSAPPVGRVEVTFSPDEKMPQLPSIPAMALPLKCSGDGAVFIKTVTVSQDARSVQFKVVSVSRDETQAFNLAAASDVYEVFLQDYTSAGSTVVFLVNATRDNRESKRTVHFEGGEQSEITGRFGEKQDFLLLFDKKGEYKKAVALDLSFTPQRIGAFASGQLLVIGYDKIRSLTQMAMIKDDGSLVRLLELPKHSTDSLGKAATESDRTMAKFPGFLQTSRLSTVQLSAYRDSLLMVLPGVTGFALEITPGGEIRRVAIKTPIGYALDSFLSSTSGLYVRFRKPTEETEPMSPSALYELDPQDGTLLREIVPLRLHSADEIACECHGEFLGLGDGKDGGRVISRGKF